MTTDPAIERYKRAQLETDIERREQRVHNRRRRFFGRLIGARTREPLDGVLEEIQQTTIAGHPDWQQNLARIEAEPVPEDIQRGKKRSRGQYRRKPRP